MVTEYVPALLTMFAYCLQPLLHTYDDIPVGARKVRLLFGHNSPPVMLQVGIDPA
jgi:hypothetical protein